MNLFGKDKRAKPYIVTKRPYGLYEVIKLIGVASYTRKTEAEKGARSFRKCDLIKERAEKIKQEYVRKKLGY